MAFSSQAQPCFSSQLACPRRCVRGLGAMEPIEDALLMAVANLQLSTEPLTLSGLPSVSPDELFRSELNAALAE
ncbi:unnamed protein product, partial [Polarella glacialis]